MNSINITGRLTADPELKQTPSGLSVTTVNVAVKRPKVKDIRYGRKGALVFATGILTTRKYTDVDGHVRQVFEIVSDDISVMNTDRAADADEPKAEQTSPVTPAFETVGNDDLPF